MVRLFFGSGMDQLVNIVILEFFFYNKEKRMRKHMMLDKQQVTLPGGQMPQHIASGALH
jgi:hypothetical protein